MTCLIQWLILDSGLPGNGSLPHRLPSPMSSPCCACLVVVLFYRLPLIPLMRPILFTCCGSCTNAHSSSVRFDSRWWHRLLLTCAFFLLLYLALMLNCGFSSAVSIARIVAPSVAAPLSSINLAQGSQLAHPDTAFKLTLACLLEVMPSSLIVGYCCMCWLNPTLTPGTAQDPGSTKRSGICISS